MDESFRRAVIAAAAHANPKISRKCPLSNLADVIRKIPRGSTEEASNLLQRLVLYSKAPPAMMHVNLLLLYTDPPTDLESSSQTMTLDPEKFVSFFTPPSIGNTSAAAQNVLDDELSDDLSSIESEVDDILRDAFLEAAEKLEKQFGSLSTSPMELLKQREATPKMRPADQSAVDKAFSKAIEAAMVRMEQTNLSSCINFVEFIVAAIDEPSTPSWMKIPLAERLIFSCVPHPDSSSGSGVLLKCLWDAILRVQSELSVDTPVEALIAAIERLPADDTVKLLLTQVIIETSLRDWAPKDLAQAIGMKIKFKVQTTTKKY